jgi:hypothetical protein
MSLPDYSVFDHTINRVYASVERSTDQIQSGLDAIQSAHQERLAKLREQQRIEQEQINQLLGK